MAMSVASSSTLEKDSVMDQTLTPGVKQELDADEFLVHLDPEEQPQNLPVAKKWAAVLAISSASLCVTSSSSMALFAEEGLAREFRISQLISVLTLSLFVEGLGLGPLLVGPLSEVYGRNMVYRISYGFFFLCSILVTFSPNAARNEGQAPPETRLVMGMLGGVLVPVGLFWMAFSTFPTAHWIALIIASVPYGAGIYFVFTSTFTYLVTAYRPIAASAMAANSALRSSFAAIFAIVARPMYLRLGTVGATAMLAGLTTLMTPLPIARIWDHIASLKITSKVVLGNGCDAPIRVNGSKWAIDSYTSTSIGEDYSENWLSTITYRGQTYVCWKKYGDPGDRGMTVNTTDAFPGKLIVEWDPDSMITGGAKFEPLPKKSEAS
ncbi:hypothetical protein H0H93_016780 [Arthromyces matolae]|nr:hypothetical protein H0H93_016780 [Arthromyces matolae]